MSTYPPGYWIDPSNPDLWPPIRVTCAYCGDRFAPEDVTQLGDELTPEHERVYLCGLLQDPKKRGCVHKWMCSKCGRVVYSTDLDRKAMTCSDCEWEREYGT